MQVTLDEDGSSVPERITDLVIVKYASLLHQLTWQLKQETEHYELNREQIDQLIESLTTIRALLVFAEDLATLDAMLRMTFPSDYYVESADMLPVLTAFPLSTEN